MNFVQWADKLADDVQHGRSNFDKRLIGPLYELAAHEAKRQGIAPPAPTPPTGKTPASPARTSRPPPPKGTPLHPDEPECPPTVHRTFGDLPWSPYYYEFRDMLASDLRQGLVGQTIGELFARAKSYGVLDAAQAAEWVEHFVEDLKRGLARIKGKR